MKKSILFLIAAELLFVGCGSQVKDNKDAEKEIIPLVCGIPANDYGEFWFTADCLNIEYPFSVQLSNGNRYGAFVEGSNVTLIYPHEAVSYPFYNVIVPYLNDDTQSGLISVDHDPYHKGLYKFEFTDNGEAYQADMTLPDGLYIYWGMETKYNPCMHNEGMYMESFFVVGDSPEALEEFSWTLYWIKYGFDQELHLRK